MPHSDGQAEMARALGDEWTGPPGIRLHDDLDRAQTFMKDGLQRVNLDSCVFHPWNRGMSGIVPLHVHEVAKDIITNGTVKDRYGHVCLVEIPAGKRQWVIDQNKAKQRGERLLPMVHPDKVKYALLTKTHFVHACKLIGDGNRTLYDKNQRRIQLLANDKEGHPLINRWTSTT